MAKVGDQSYLVQTDEGNMYRWSRKFIQTVPYTTDELESADQPITVSAPVTSAETTEPLHTELELTESNETQEDSSEQNSEPRTTSGRVVKQLERYKDYVRL